MDLVNSRVRHKAFGVGRVCELKENVISVQFGLEVKKFIFPDAFRQYLIMTEQRSKKYIDGILNEIDSEIMLKRESELLAEAKRNALKSLPLHANAQAAFKFIENEKENVLANWSVFTGRYLTGLNRGKPRTPLRIYPNSACLLTSCGEYDSEDKRFIWGVFMARDEFIGCDCTDGLIPAHDKYRIILDEGESGQLAFWNNVSGSSGSQLSKWGSSEMRYLSNKAMANILHKILLIKQGTKQEQLCKEFLDYFCKLNKIDREQFRLQKCE